MRPLTSLPKSSVRDKGLVLGRTVNAPVWMRVCGFVKAEGDSRSRIAATGRRYVRMAELMPE